MKSPLVLLLPCDSVCFEIRQFLNPRRRNTFLSGWYIFVKGLECLRHKMPKWRNSKMTKIIAFSTKENAYYLSLFRYRTWSSNRSVCMRRYLGQAWHISFILPRSFSPGSWYLFCDTHLQFIRRWSVGDFLFTTGLFIVFLTVFN